MPSTSPFPWLAHAWADLGLADIAGPGTAPRITAYYADAGHPEITSDDIAWCAAFVGACLRRAGLTNTGSLVARSYAAFGTHIEEARPGAIAVFSRGSDRLLGHVAFVVGETSEALLVLGGNQSHKVSVVEMPRSRLIALRWPSPPSDAAVSTIPDPAFDRALAHVLALEGGYSNDPHDTGGPTNLGITLADFARYRNVPATADLIPAIKALTRADVAPIYRTFYWQPCRAPDLPPALALFHFDAAVNHGLGAAVRMLQQALAVTVDGGIGPQTLAAAQNRNVGRTLTAYADIRRARYRALSTFWRFGRGWLARVDATLAAAQPLISERLPMPQPPTPQPKNTPMTDTPSPAPAAAAPKWWGQSMTIWGAIITTLATVLPVAGPLIGLDISADIVRQIGDGVVRTVQSLAGLAGIVMTVYGRSRATQSLVRRDVLVRL